MSNQNDNYVQFGYHLTLDIYSCPFEVLVDLELCHNALKKAVEVLEMHALIPPYVFRADSNEENGGKDPGGITGFIVIAESHISLHTFAKRGFVSIDVYSCKKFNYISAQKHFENIFRSNDVEVHTLDRGTRYPVNNIY
ncbi:S-adenosylmethionine decarboxylase [Candidatus Dojkabacteria bacterium]|uniref:S-adenosylmethionine decarboxylase n=1 Tax=Candidatus Dojkabacteria bacterium TaxID=2099670 RepID=A0A955LA27_9BACT|nr:S-adenosylmethionine decarboxylase [Candidatus Dojkabacteria bacterium]